MSDALAEGGAAAPDSRRWFVAVWLAVFAAYLLTGIGTSGDSRWSLPTAQSILYEGDTDLNEFGGLIEAWGLAAIEVVDGAYYTQFPKGVSVLALPFVAVFDLGFRAVREWAPHMAETLRDRGVIAVELSAVTFYWRIEQVIASFYVALASAVLYLIARRRGLERGGASVVSGVFAFCTPAWSIGSTALWQHGPSMLFLSVGLWCLLHERPGRGVLLVCGMALGFSYVLRPTNSISLVLLGGYVVLRYGRASIAYVAGAAAVLLPFIMHNYGIYESFLPPYFQANRVPGGGHFFEALAGNVISPGRGLLVYSPAFLFSIVGIGILLRRGLWRPLESTLVLIVALHWIVISLFPHWWGGVCFGPRLFSDMTPYLVYFLIPVVGALRERELPLRRTLAVSLVLLAGASAAIHFRGASSMTAWQWNFTPRFIDRAPERVWDWSDLSFFRR